MYRNLQVFPVLNLKWAPQGFQNQIFKLTAERPDSVSSTLMWKRLWKSEPSWSVDWLLLLVKLQRDYSD